MLPATVPGNTPRNPQVYTCVNRGDFGGTDRSDADLGKDLVQIWHRSGTGLWDRSGTDLGYR